MSGEPLCAAMHTKVLLLCYLPNGHDGDHQFPHHTMPPRTGPSAEEVIAAAIYDYTRVPPPKPACEAAVAALRAHRYMAQVDTSTSDFFDEQGQLP